MKTNHTFFTDQYGKKLFLYRWLPEGHPCAVVQIIHGMAEHAARYERLARYLTDRGLAVYADDHRGHGLSVADGKSWGVLADTDGFAKMVEDEKEITDRIKETHPNIPVILTGHSMGSFIARCYVTRYGKEIDGLVLSGTGTQSYAELYGGLLIANLQRFSRGKNYPSKLLDQLVFGHYNRKFAPNRTSFDWLSSEKREVDLYIADPMCGNIFPTGFYIDFFNALLFLKQHSSVEAIPMHLPILFLSGTKDPIGSFGKGVRQIYDQYRKHNIQNLEILLFPEGRHEMLNERNREEVMQKLYDWIQRNGQTH